MPAFGGVLLAPPVQRWECYGCNRTLATPRAKPGIPLHRCRNGLAMPFVPEGQRRKVVTHVREDYVGGDDVQLDADGRPVMNTTVERDDGYDTAVYAPCATATGEDIP